MKVQKLLSLVQKYVVYAAITRIKGYSIKRDLNYFLKSQYFDKQQLNRIQKAKLERLVLQAKKASFYQNLTDFTNLQEIGDWLVQQPILEKDQLRNFEQQMLTRKPGFRDTVKTSGGSTGAAVTLFKDANAMSKELSATWRGYHWAGIDIGDLQARFWGIPHTRSGKIKAKITDMVTYRIRYSAFNFSEADLRDYARSIARYQPKYFYGYVSLLRELALCVEKYQLQACFSSVTSVITTSEVLTEADRVRFEVAFGAKVYNEYGCGEVGTIAHECEHGTMHLNDENTLIEVVNDNGERLPNGQIGHLIVTDLNNQLMPLIRYRIGDMGAVSDSRCQCGRSLQVLEGISGRAYDLVRNRAGKVFHGEFFLYFIEELKSEGFPMSGVQFLMSPNKATINVVCKPVDFESISAQIRIKLKSEFDAHIEIEVKVVDVIPRETSGKLRVVKVIS